LDVPLLSSPPHPCSKTSPYPLVVTSIIKGYCAGVAPVIRLSLPPLPFFSSGYRFSWKTNGPFNPTPEFSPSSLSPLTNPWHPHFSSNLVFLPGRRFFLAKGRVVPPFQPRSPLTTRPSRDPGPPSITSSPTVFPQIPDCKGFVGESLFQDYTRRSLLFD